MHRRQDRLVGAVVILQPDEHREHDEQAVFRPPRFRRLAQEEILEWRRCERVEPAVDASRICLQDGTVARRQHRHGGSCFGSKSVFPGFAISSQGPSADQRCQLPGGAAPREIHLEEAILCVEESRGAGDVFTRSPLNHRDSQCISRHRHRSRRACEAIGAVEQRQTGSQLVAGPQTGTGGHHDQQQPREQKEAANGQKTSK